MRHDRRRAGCAHDGHAVAFLLRQARGAGRGVLWRDRAQLCSRPAGGTLRIGDFPIIPRKILDCSDGNVCSARRDACTCFDRAVAGTVRRADNEQRGPRERNALVPVGRGLCRSSSSAFELDAETRGDRLQTIARDEHGLVECRHAHAPKYNCRIFQTLVSMLAADPLTVRNPTLWDRVRSRVVYSGSYAKRRLIPDLTLAEAHHAETLARDGCVVIENAISPDRLQAMQADLDAALRALDFEMPCLAQTRIAPERHRALIENFLYGSTREFIEAGITFDRGEAQSYGQVLREFNPSTLTVYMLERSQAYRDAWLDPSLLAIVAAHMGIVPKLSEAYVRRNFPAPYRTMNHFWHRDLNTPLHLLKAFFFLTDCGPENGPHEFVRGSHRNLGVLNGKRYFSDNEVDGAFPPNGSEREMSVVRAGTVIIEDTRGLHRAKLPEAGYRDLGYAVFMPLRPFYGHGNYRLPRAFYSGLSDFQKAFVPAAMLS